MGPGSVHLHLRQDLAGSPCVQRICVPDGWGKEKEIRSRLYSGSLLELKIASFFKLYLAFAFWHANRCSAGIVGSQSPKVCYQLPGACDRCAILGLQGGSSGELPFFSKHLFSPLVLAVFAKTSFFVWHEGCAPPYCRVGCGVHGKYKVH